MVSIAVLTDQHRKETVQQNLRYRIQEQIAPRVPEAHWSEVDRPLPFRTHPGEVDSVVFEALPHADGTLRSDAVYVLECRYTGNWNRVAAERLSESTTKLRRWAGVDGADRLIYVGRAANLVRRLSQHVRPYDGAGAHFTQIFRPVRTLDISWHRRADVGRAERMVAKALRDRFPDDYVYQQ